MRNKGNFFPCISFKSVHKNKNPPVHWRKVKLKEKSSIIKRNSVRACERASVCFCVPSCVLFSYVLFFKKRRVQIDFQKLILLDWCACEKGCKGKKSTRKSNWSFCVVAFSLVVECLFTRVCEWVCFCEWKCTLKMSWNEFWFCYGSIQRAIQMELLQNHSSVIRIRYLGLSAKHRLRRFDRRIKN